MAPRKAAPKAAPKAPRPKAPRRARSPSSDDEAEISPRRPGRAVLTLDERVALLNEKDGTNDFVVWARTRTALVCNLCLEEGKPTPVQALSGTIYQHRNGIRHLANVADLQGTATVAATEVGARLPPPPPTPPTGVAGVAPHVDPILQAARGDETLEDFLFDTPATSDAILNMLTATTALAPPPPPSALPTSMRTTAVAPTTPSPAPLRQLTPLSTTVLPALMLAPEMPTQRARCPTELEGFIATLREVAAAAASSAAASASSAATVRELTAYVRELTAYFMSSHAAAHAAPSPSPLAFGMSASPLASRTPQASPAAPAMQPTQRSAPSAPPSPTPTVAAAVIAHPSTTPSPFAKPRRTVFNAPASVPPAPLFEPLSREALAELARPRDPLVQVPRPASSGDAQAALAAELFRQRVIAALNSNPALLQL